MLRHHYLHSFTFLLTLGLIATLVTAEFMHNHPGKHNHHDDPNGCHNKSKDDNGEHDGHTHRHLKWESPPTSYASKCSDLWTNDDAIARGKKIYQTHGELCYGPDGQGTGSAAKWLPHAPADLTHHFHIKPGDGDAYFFWRVSEGGMVEPFKSMQSAMPAFKTVLSEGQRWDVAIPEWQGMMQQMHGQMGGVMMGDRDDDGSSDDDGMMGRGMMRGRGGIMGHMQHMMARLTERLNLSDEQQSKVQALLPTYVKEAIRLKAEIDTTHIDLQQLLDAQPIDMDRVKTALQAIAGKEVELRLAHIAAIQDIQKLLTPEQQTQFRTMWGHMLGRGGMMGRGGMQGSKSGN